VFKMIGAFFEFLTEVYRDLRPSEAERHARELRRISRELEEKEKKIRDKMVHPYTSNSRIDPDL